MNKKIGAQPKFSNEEAYEDEGYDEPTAPPPQAPPRANPGSKQPNKPNGNTGAPNSIDSIPIGGGNKKNAADIYKQGKKRKHRGPEYISY